MAPDMFWCLTPWQFSVALRGLEEKQNDEWDRQLFFTFLGADLPRMKRAPKFKEFTAKTMRAKSEKNKKPVKGVNEDAIMGWLKAYQRQREEHKEDIES